MTKREEYSFVVGILLLFYFCIVVKFCVKYYSHIWTDKFKLFHNFKPSKQLLNALFLTVETVIEYISWWPGCRGRSRARCSGPWGTRLAGWRRCCSLTRPWRRSREPHSVGCLASCPDFYLKVKQNLKSQCPHYLCSWN
jgi:hypothetical protein